MRRPSASEQSLEYIRNYYSVPARVGKHVEYNGRRGVVTGGVNAYVEVRLEEEKNARPYHPHDLNWLPGEYIEYVRADLLQQPTSERCGDVVSRVGVMRVINALADSRRLAAEEGEGPAYAEEIELCHKLVYAIQSLPGSTVALDELRQLRQQIEDTVLVAQTESDDQGFITAYHFQTGAIHRLLAAARKGEGAATGADEGERRCAGCKRMVDVGLLLCPTCVDEGHAECRPPANVAAAPGPEAAIEAAREIASALVAEGYLRDSDGARLESLNPKFFEAIISKHIPEAGEVEEGISHAIIQTQREWRIWLWNEFQAGVRVSNEDAREQAVRNARANAIREAVVKVQHLRRNWDRCVEVNPRQRGLVFEALDEVTAALQSLLDKKEGEDG